MKESNNLLRLVGMAGLVVLVVCVCFGGQVSLPLLFKPLTIQSFTAVIASLFAVALFVERANEVVVMFFRDQQAELLENEEARANELVKTTTAAVTALASNASANQTERDAAGQAAASAQLKAADAHEATLRYRGETKQIALTVGFLFGTLVSLSGVRALQGLLPENANTTPWFTIADVLVTGAMLAGGSEGIHRIANVFTSFMDGLSSQIDQKSKK